MADEMILIIDDSANTRLLLSLRLKALGGTGPSLRPMPWRPITRARQAQPDAILLDVGLPGGNGLMVLERLKANTSLGASRSSS